MSNPLEGEIHKEAMLDYNSVQRGIADIEIKSKYYDVANTITKATATDPGDADATTYDVETIYDHIQKRGRKVWVANDAARDGATIFVRVAHNGMNTFSPETPIYPQQFKVYYNCYELRLRSPIIGTPYRVTEYELGAL